MNRTITFELPEELVEEAEQAGLLTSEKLAQFLKSELEREELRNEFGRTLAQLHALEPRMTPEEIQAELDAHRAEKAAKRQALQP